MLNNRIIVLTSIFISLTFLPGCQDEAPQVPVPEVTATQPAEKKPAGDTSGSVIESIDASVYTYVQVQNNGEKIWMAGPKTTITKGGSIDVNTNAPMRNFHSKALNRDFPVVYFVDHFTGSAVQNSTVEPVASATDLPAGHTSVAKPQTTSSNEIILSQPVERAEGGHTIAEIIANKGELSGKQVKVRGKVTKFTGGVMNKNWIHMIDGSGDTDLTVITDQVAATGQMIVIEGTVLLDKDFGYGYFYELLIEDAKITVE